MNRCAYHPVTFRGQKQDNYVTKIKYNTKVVGMAEVIGLVGQPPHSSFVHSGESLEDAARPGLSIRDPLAQFI